MDWFVFYFLRIYLSFHLLFLLINSQVINLHSDDSHQGIKQSVNISQCSNLALGMAREVTSVNTKGHCAAFYDGRNCTGNSIEVLPHTPTHYNLHFWGFNDKALSVGPCADPCDEKITGKNEPNGTDILIYNRKDFKGAYAELKVKGCTLIPTKFVHQLLSVKTFDNCLQFYDYVDCRTTSSDGWETIELRKGTPFHNDITSWHFPVARAVSHCSFKCNTNAAVETVQKAYPTAPGQVFVFDDKDFKGNQLNLQLDGCTTFENYWEGMAVSLKTFNGSCVVLFDKRGCTGDSINIHGEHSDLSGRSFDGVARSIAPCLKPNLETTPKEEFGTKEGKSSVNSSLSPLILAVIIVVPLLAIILSVALVLLIMRRCNPYKNNIEMLSEKEIEEFINGLGMEVDPMKAEANASNLPCTEDYPVEYLAQNKPYNESFEIPREKVKFDTKMPLGIGEFGVVYKGTVQILTEDEDEASQEIQAVPVAVKTVKPNSSAHCLRSLLKEVKVMIFVGKHSNIIQMIGCCTENLRKGEVLILMEFCPRGSLESFLQKNRSSFVNIVEKGRLIKDAVVKVDNDCRKLEEIEGYAHLDAKIPPSFDFFQLLQWCIEISSGMEFLSSKKVVHSDLAARNILLDGGFRAKISDFGLSKQLYCYTQYVKKKQEPLPWRYLAIESLKNMEFSSKSDVWGWGVLAWEIFTLGEKPYPGVVWSEGFIRNLEDGLRLGKPKCAVTECYNLMLQCWSDEPEMRPTFSELLADLIEISTSLKSPYGNRNRGGSNNPYRSQPYVTLT